MPLFVSRVSCHRNRNRRRRARPASLTESNGDKMYFGIRSGKDSCLPFWYPFNGALDNVRIYNRSLNEAEIEALYYAAV